MAIELGELILSIRADASDLYESMEKAKADVGMFGMDVEQMLGGVKAPELATLTPKVDLTHLHELNKEFDVKAAHKRSLQADFDAAPLTPKVDLSGLDALSGKLADVQKQFDALSFDKRLTASSRMTESYSVQRSKRRGTQKPAETLEAELAEITSGNALVLDLRIEESSKRSIRQVSSQTKREFENAIAEGFREGMKPSLLGKAFNVLNFTAGNIIEGVLTRGGEKLFDTVFGSAFGSNEDIIKIDPASIQMAFTQGMAGISGDLATQISAGVTEGMKNANKKGPFQKVFGGVFDTIEDTFTGFNEQIGATFGAQIGMGMMEEFESSLDFSFKSLGQKRAKAVVGVGNTVVKGANNLLGINAGPDGELKALGRAANQVVENALGGVESVSQWADQATQIIGDRFYMASFKMGDGVIATFEQEGLVNKIQSFWNEAFDLTEVSQGIREMVQELGQLELNLYPKPTEEDKKGLSLLGKIVDSTLRTRRQKGIELRAAGLAEERAREILNSREQAESEGRRAKTRNTGFVVDEQTEELIIATGGYGTIGGRSGLRIPRAIRNQLGENTKAISVDSPDTDIAERTKPEMLKSLAKPNLRGFNLDSLEMVAQALVALDQNPEVTIKFLGESGGGFVAEDAAAILKEMGYQNVEYLGVGTPELAGGMFPGQSRKIISQDESLGKDVAAISSRYGMADIRASNQNILGVEEHPIEGYLEAQVPELMHFLGKELESLSDADVQAMKASAKEFAEAASQSIGESSQGEFAKLAFQNMNLMRRQALAATADSMRDELEAIAKQFEDVFVTTSSESSQMTQIRQAITQAQTIYEDIKHNPGIRARETVETINRELEVIRASLDLAYKGSSGTERAKYLQISDQLTAQQEQFSDKRLGRVRLPEPEPVSERPLEMPVGDIPQSPQQIATTEMALPQDVNIPSSEIAHSIADAIATGTEDGIREGFDALTDNNMVSSSIREDIVSGFVDGFQEAIASINIGDTIREQLVSGLAQGFDEGSQALFSDPSLVQAISGPLIDSLNEGIQSGLGEGLESLVENGSIAAGIREEIVSGFSDGFTEGVEAVNFNDAIAITLRETIVSGFAQGFEDIQLPEDIGQELITAVVESLSDGIADALTDGADILSDSDVLSGGLRESIISGLNDALADIGEVLGQGGFTDQIGERISSAFTDGIDSASDASLDSFAEAIRDAVGQAFRQGLEDGVSDIAESGLEESLRSAITEAYSLIEMEGMSPESGRMAGAAFAEAVIEMLDTGLVETGERIGQTITESLEESLGGASIADELGEKVKSAIEGVDLIGQYAQISDLAKTDLSTTVQNLVAELIQTVDDAIANIPVDQRTTGEGQRLAGMKGRLVQAQQRIDQQTQPQAVAETPLEAAKGIGQQFSMQRRTILQLGPDDTLAKQAAAELKASKDEARQALDDLQQSLGDDIDRSTRQAISTARGQITNALKVADEIETDGIDVGRNFAEGTRQGILSSIEAVQAIARQLASGIDEAARDELDIQSPSRKGYDIGFYYGEGIRMGMLSTVEAIAQSSAAIGQGLAGTLDMEVAQTAGRLFGAEILKGLDDQLSARVGLLVKHSLEKTLEYSDVAPGNVAVPRTTRAALGEQNSKGQYLYPDNELRMDARFGGRVGISAETDMDSLVKVLLHEMRHGVQMGFSQDADAASMFQGVNARTGGLMSDRRFFPERGRMAYQQRYEAQGLDPRTVSRMVRLEDDAHSFAGQMMEAGKGQQVIESFDNSMASAFSRVDFAYINDFIDAAERTTYELHGIADEALIAADAIAQMNKIFGQMERIFPDKRFTKQLKAVRLPQAGGDMSGQGANVGESFAAGITAKIGEVKSAAVDMANAVERAIEVELQISSPSKVAMFLGEMFGEGFVESVQDKAKQAYESAKELAQSAKDGLKDNTTLNELGKSKLGQIAKGKFNEGREAAQSVVTDAIASLQSDLEQQAQNIQDSLTEARDGFSESAAVTAKQGAIASIESLEKLSKKIAYIKDAALNAPGEGTEWEDSVRAQVESVEAAIDQLRGKVVDLNENQLGNVQLPDGPAEAVEAIGDATEGLGEKLKKGALAVVGFVASFKLLEFVQENIGELLNDSVQTAIEFQRLETTLKFVTGSASDAADQIARISAESKRLGTDAFQSIQGFAQLASATRGTSLEGVATEQISAAIQQAGAVSQIDQQQLEQANTAITQIAGKGVLSAEELRQQLSEVGGVFAGSFQIAARSLGVTTSELDKMLQRGEILSEDFLPKFAQQLSAETASGVAGAAKTAQASINRFNNAIGDLQNSVGEQLLPARQVGLEVAANLMERMVGLAPLVLQGLTAISIKLGIDAAMAAGLLSKSLAAVQARLVGVNATGGMAGLVTGLKSASAAAIGFGKALLAAAGPFLAVFAGIEALKIGYKAFFSDVSGEMGDLARAAEEAANAYEMAAEKARAFREGEAPNLGARDQKEALRNQENAFEGIWGLDWLADIGSVDAEIPVRLIPVVGLIPGWVADVDRHFKKRSLQAQMEADEATLGQYRDAIAAVDSELIQSATERVREIDAKIAQLTGLAQNTTDLEARQALRRQIGELQKERESQAGVVGSLQGQLAEQEQNLLRREKMLEESLANKKLTQSEYNSALSENIDLLDGTQVAMANLGDEVETVANSLVRMQDELSKAAAIADDMALENAIANAQDQLSLAQRQGSVGDSAFEQLSGEAEIAAIQREIELNATRMQGIKDALDKTSIQNAFDALEGEGISRGLNPNELLDALAKTGLETTQVQELTRFAEESINLKGLEAGAIELDAQLVNTQADLRQQARDLSIQYRDLSQEIADFYQEAYRSAEDVVNTIMSQDLQNATQEISNNIQRELLGLEDSFVSGIGDTFTGLIESLRQPLLDELEAINQRNGVQREFTDQLRAARDMQRQVDEFNFDAGLGADPAANLPQARSLNNMENGNRVIEINPLGGGIFSDGPAAMPMGQNADIAAARDLTTRSRDEQLASIDRNLATQAGTASLQADQAIANIARQLEEGRRTIGEQSEGFTRSLRDIGQGIGDTNPLRELESSLLAVSDQFTDTNRDLEQFKDGLRDTIAETSTVRQQLLEQVAAGTIGQEALAILPDLDQTIAESQAALTTADRQVSQNRELLEAQREQIIEDFQKAEDDRRKEARRRIIEGRGAIATAQIDNARVSPFRLDAQRRQERDRIINQARQESISIGFEFDADLSELDELVKTGEITAMEYETLRDNLESLNGIRLDGLRGQFEELLPTVDSIASALGAANGELDRGAFDQIEDNLRLARQSGALSSDQSAAAQAGLREAERLSRRSDASAIRGLIGTDNAFTSQFLSQAGRGDLVGIADLGIQNREARRVQRGLADLPTDPNALANELTRPEFAQPNMDAATAFVEGSDRMVAALDRLTQALSESNSGSGGVQIGQQVIQVSRDEEQMQRAVTKKFNALLDQPL